MRKELHKTKHESVSLVSAGMYTAPAGVGCGHHRHGYWELVYYREGRVTMRVGGQDYPAVSGAVLITPPGVEHAEIDSQGYANYFVVLDAPADMHWPVRGYDTDDQAVRSVFRQLVHEYLSLGIASERMLQLLCAQLVLYLDRLNLSPEGNTPQRLVAQAERIFMEELATPLRIESVARRLHVSSASLRGYFRSVRGCSPHQRLASLRLNRARELLMRSDLKLEAIAEFCGFHSASHLTRHCHAAWGHPPGVVRNPS